MVPLSRPAPKQCFTPRCPVNCCASTHFGENQLALGSIGISPLTTPHPPIFQHRSVRTSTWCYPSFILDMVRSPGFGSINTDIAPYSDSLSLWLAQILLSPTSAYKSPAHSSTGTRSDVESSSHCLSADGFMFYFTPLIGVLFTFPSRYWFTIGHTVVFSLTEWSRLIH